MQCKHDAMKRRIWKKPELCSDTKNTIIDDNSINSLFEQEIVSNSTQNEEINDITGDQNSHDTQRDDEGVAGETAIVERIIKKTVSC